MCSPQKHINTLILCKLLQLLLQRTALFSHTTETHFPFPFSPRYGLHASFSPHFSEPIICLCFSNLKYSYTKDFDKPMWLNLTCASRSISRRFFLVFFLSFFFTWWAGSTGCAVTVIQTHTRNHWILFWRALKRAHQLLERAKMTCFNNAPGKIREVACLLEIIHPPCHSPLPWMFHFPSNHYNNCLHWMKNVRMAASHSILKSDSWAVCEMQAFNIIMLIVTHRLPLFVT